MKLRAKPQGYEGWAIGVTYRPEREFLAGIGFFSSVDYRRFDPSPVRTLLFKTRREARAMWRELERRRRDSQYLLGHVRYAVRCVHIAVIPR